MRIIGGTFKGRQLVAPKGATSRPTSDRTRESLFNVLTARDPSIFKGARVLDLFAGTGALGFEALSRGASFSLFVETDSEARGAIRENIEALNVFGTTRIHRRSAIDLGTKPASAGPVFSLVFADAPYEKGLSDPALRTIVEGNWLTTRASIIVEQSIKEQPATHPNMEEVDRRTFGISQIGIYKFSQ